MSTRNPERSSYLFALATAALFFLIGLATLNQYGYIWDTPENLLTGSHYLRFFSSGNRQWLDFAAYDEIYRNTGENRPLFYNREFNAPERYPPLANVAANGTHRLFTIRLGLLEEIDGYHLSVVLFAALAVFVLACFTWQAWGPLASFVGTMALVTYPLFFEHAHNNLKDVPFAALVLLALWAYWQGQQRKQWRWLLLSAIATGLAMGVRVLAVQVWLIIGLAYLPQVWARRDEGWQRALRPYHPLLVHIPLALLIFLAAWPWLWPDPAGRLAAHLAFGRNVSRGVRVLYNGQLYRSGVTLPWHYTAVIFTLTTPLLVLVGGLLGYGTAVKRGVQRQDAAALMLSMLFLLAIIHTSWPGIPQYDGTRHMLNGVVAFAGLFGLGFQQAWEFITGVWRNLKLPAFHLKFPLRPSAPLLLCLLIFLPTIFWNIRLHPYQGIYYNVLAGGPVGAFDRYPLEYWGSSFRLGTAWLNENTEGNALVLPRVGGHLARYYVSPDRQIIPDEALPTLPPDQPVLIIYMTRRDKFDWIAEFADASLAPIHELKRGGVPVLKIAQTDAQTLQQAQP